jgi:septum site-determining protein MinC
LPRKLDVELKGGMYTFMSLKLYTGDIDTIDQCIADKVQQAPGFFKDTPVVIDLTDLDVAELSLDTSALLERIRRHKLVPIVASVVNKNGPLGQQIALPLIEGLARRVKSQEPKINKSQSKPAAKSLLAGVPATAGDFDDSLDDSLDAVADTDAVGDSSRNAEDSVPAGAVDGTDIEVEAELEPLSAQEVQYIVKQPQLMRRPVRSGQQVYARDTDLIVMGQVGPGAEVIADNHIHIYGALRGRALCGVTGNTEARIFCQSLEAELVSVAGNYRVLESIPEDLRGKPAQIWLDEERLNIEPL